MLRRLGLGVGIVAVVDPAANVTRFIGLAVVPSFADLAEPCDAVLLTDLKDPVKTLAQAREHFGAERVLVPDLLTGRIRNTRGRAA